MNGKMILKSTFLLSALGMVQTVEAQERPNIIMFLVDDMGWQDTSVPFHTEMTNLNRRYKTPNMERLAEKGVKFMQAYACPVSSPSRCSLMSGMNAARHRVTNWTLKYDQKTDAGSTVITPPDWNYNGIQPATTTNAADKKNTTLITSLPQILQDNGYYTIHCGKAHFGARSTSGADPLKMGFLVNIAGSEIGGPGSYLGTSSFGKGGDFAVPGLEKYHGQDIFLTEAITREALAALEQPVTEKKPFYLYMSHYAVHAPYEADERYAGYYRNVDDPYFASPLGNTEVSFATLVEGMDKSLGDIMNFLDEKGIAENTIILFMSDNGGQAVGQRQGRHNYDQNWPARAGKGSAFMGGVREPMMVYWPGVTQPGTEVQQHVMIEDFFPTILEMAQVESYEPVQTVDGISFVDVLKDPSVNRERPIVWHFPNLWGETQDKTEGYGAFSAILKGDYHLIYHWENQKRELYNIKTDIGERTDLAASEPEILEELSQDLTDFLKKTNAQRPVYKASGQPCPYPNEAVQVADVGDVLKLSNQIFKLSNEYKKFYYTISDANVNTSNVGASYYWTLGSHYGYNAIQAKAQKATDFEELKKQLFYFLPGQDDQHFRIMTYDGQQVDYVDGKTASGWNNGNPDQATSTVTAQYMQYGTTTAGEFVIRKSARENYYGIGTSDGKVMNTRGGANGAAGIADMKWIINDYGGGLNVLQNNNGCQYAFTLYDDGTENLFYKEGMVTEMEQLADGDLVMLQNVQQDDPSVQGMLYSLEARLTTKREGLYHPELTWMKRIFGESSVFIVKKNGNEVSFISLSDGLYVPNDVADGEAYYLASASDNTLFTMTPSAQVERSWEITSTATGLSIGADQDCPVAAGEADAFRIYKVSTTQAEQTPVWMYLATYNLMDQERVGRSMQVGKTEGELKLWTAPAVETNNELQMWTLDESPVETDVFALRNRAFAEESGVGEVTGPGTTGARYTYDESTKNYLFAVEKAGTAKGTNTLNLRRKEADGWYVNASAAGQEFYVNEWSKPNEPDYMSGAWSPVLVADLKDTGDDALGALCTFSAPYPVVLPQGMSAYIASKVDATTLWLSPLELTDQILPAETPVMLQSSEAGSYPMLQTASAATEVPEGNLFVGSYADRMLVPSNGCYVLGSQNGKVAFMNYTGEAVPAFRIYLPRTEPGVTVMAVKIAGNPSTGIHDVVGNEQKDAPIYNLMGQKVIHPQKGIFIQNGKKIVIE